MTHSRAVSLARLALRLAALTILAAGAFVLTTVIVVVGS